MCGLVGVAGNLFARDTKYFEQALFADQLRGHHSTGIYEVDAKSKDLTWYKKAVNASDFLQLDVAKSMITTTAMLLAGHNRWATVGAHTDNNAHPFIHGDIALMHNGTLTSRKGLSTKSFTVDSEHIAYTISQCASDEEVLDVLEDLDGAFALIWYNYQTGKLYMARNSERELCIGSSKAGNIYWASEQKMMEWICSRKGIDVTLETTESLPVGELWSFDISDKGSVYASKEVAMFTPYTKSYSKGYQGYGGGYGYAGGHSLMASLGMSIGDFICFKADTFSKWAQGIKGTLSGTDLATGTKIICYAADPADLVFNEDGSLNTATYYWASVEGDCWPSTGGKGLRVDSKTLYEDVTEAKKLPAVIDETVRYVIDGEAMSEYEMRELCSIGCSLCGNPYTEDDVMYAKRVKDTGTEYMHPECLEEWNKLLEEEDYGEIQPH